MAKMEDQLSAMCARVCEEECPARALSAFWDFSQWFIPVGVYVLKGISIFLEALFIWSMMALIIGIEAALLYFAKSFCGYVKRKIYNNLHPQNNSLQLTRTALHGLVFVASAVLFLKVFGITTLNALSMFLFVCIMTGLLAGAVSAASGLSGVIDNLNHLHPQNNNMQPQPQQALIKRRWG